jgi:hypothetical protein
MRCQELEDLREAYRAAGQAYQLSVEALVKLVSGPRAEFWGALKLAESAKDDCTQALQAIDFHITEHECQAN